MTYFYVYSYYGGKMSTERDKFLTKAMGKCWHEWEHFRGWRCPKCGSLSDNKESERPLNPNFSTWEGFGKLWSWMSSQEWKDEFMDNHVFLDSSVQHDYMFEFINPNKFADAVYTYLMEKK